MQKEGSIQREGSQPQTNKQDAPPTGGMKVGWQRVPSLAAAGKPADGNAHDASKTDQPSGVFSGLQFVFWVMAHSSILKRRWAALTPRHLPAWHRAIVLPWPEKLLLDLSVQVVMIH